LGWRKDLVLLSTIKHVFGIMRNLSYTNAAYNENLPAGSFLWSSLRLESTDLEPLLFLLSRFLQETSWCHSSLQVFLIWWHSSLQFQAVGIAGCKIEILALVLRLERANSDFNTDFLQKVETNWSYGTAQLTSVYEFLEL
jgi:hypothetical protein